MQDVINPLIRAIDRRTLLYPGDAEYVTPSDQSGRGDSELGATAHGVSKSSPDGEGSSFGEKQFRLSASYFSCFAKKSNQKKPAPGSPVLRTALCCSPRRAAAQLALAIKLRGLRQCSPTSPGEAVLLGGSQGEAKTNGRIRLQACFIARAESLVRRRVTQTNLGVSARTV